MGLQDDEEAYKRQFSRYIKLGVSADDLEAIYTKAHAAIRKDPFAKRGALEKGRFLDRKEAKAKDQKYPKKYYKATAITVKQRKSRIKDKLMAVGLTPVFDKL